MGDRIRVLFLCTANCCRSQMAEALMRHRGGDEFEVFSAGSHPSGYVHPLVPRTMAVLNVPMHEGRSKSWEEFRDRPMDLILTLCDHAAGEKCPNWPGAPVQVHWPLPDPVSIDADETEVLRFSRRVAERLDGMIQQLVGVNWTGMDAAQRRDYLLQVGRSELPTA